MTNGRPSPSPSIPRTSHDAASRFSAVPAVSRSRVLALAVMGARARAELHLDITQGKIEPLPIAIPAFAGGAGAVGQRHHPGAVGRSRALRPLQAASIRRPSSNRTRRRARRRLMPTGASSTRRRWSPAMPTTQPDGSLQVEFRLWDVFARAAADGHALYDARAQNWRPHRAHRSPTRSISASPARTAISTPASSISRETGPQIGASSGSRSWIRTAPTTAI